MKVDLEACKRLGITPVCWYDPLEYRGSGAARRVTKWAVKGVVAGTLNRFRGGAPTK